MAEGVERFDPDYNYENMEAEPLGDWVRYSDYEKLRKALEEAEDRFMSCDNCERPSREEDLETIWCQEPESGEQVDARICLVCRLEAQRDQARPGSTNCPEHGDLCGRPNWTGYCRWRVERASNQSPDYYDALSAAESRIGELEKKCDQARQEALEEVRAGLETHFLAQIERNHDTEQDRPICGCSEVDLGWHPSVGVGVAIDIWIDHFLATLDPSGEECERCGGYGKARAREGDPDSLGYICEDCKGTGKKPVPHPSGEQGEETPEQQIGDLLAEQANALMYEDDDSSAHWPRATIAVKLPMERNGATPLYCGKAQIGYRSSSATSADGNEIELWFALDPAYFTTQPPATDTSKEER